MIRYVSTRGGGKPKSFTEAILEGMAPDGGLYVPDSWPALDHAILQNLSGMSYADAALAVIRPFIGDDIGAADLQRIVFETYQGDAFNHAAVAPLVQIGPNAWLLELFHGPTFSFKDYALQLLGRLFDYVLEKRNRRMTIVGATSGDTGSAAIEACRRSKNIDIFILHPQGRTSEIQRRQMTTVQAPNVFNIALEGTFDDCQAVVKELFADRKFSEEMNLSAVNSINWARIMAQIVYYAASCVALGGGAGRPVSFAVPTGNFGNVFAAYAARAMELPIHRIVVASNRNDILTRFFETGEMKIEPVTPTLAPSMDIQVSSNFERYLYDLCGRDAKAVGSMMNDFKTKKSFRVNANLHERARRDFSAFRCTDERIIDVMRECHKATGQIIDPHTAAGLYGAMQAMREDPSVPMVVAATAHPAKFPDAVQKALGIAPPQPEALSRMMKRAEEFVPMSNDAARVRSYIRANAGRG